MGGIWDIQIHWRFYDNIWLKLERENRDKSEAYLMWSWRKGVVASLKMASSNPCLLVFMAYIVSVSTLNPFLSE